MTFAANRDMKIEASETGAGVFTLRTRGLASRRRPELEIAGVPEAALNGAGGVINLMAEYSVNKAEVLADQTVGNVLGVGDDGRKVLLAVRAVSVEPPQTGLWSKLTGGSKGVLRLVDVIGGGSGPPLTAMATMHVHRAAVRLAKDDEAGARAELETAIATFPGEAGAGEAPAIGGADGAYNWQNHLAYLDLAKLSADDVEEAAAWFGEALARAPELARRELGASLDAVLGLDDGEVATEVARIVAHAAHEEGAASERLAREGAALATKILARDRTTPWRLAWIARETRALRIGDEAPRLEPTGPAHPAHGLASLVLADVARCFQAGATEAEILARYAARAGSPSAELTSIEAKLATRADWEAEQYMKAVSSEEI